MAGILKLIARSSLVCVATASVALAQGRQAPPGVRVWIEDAADPAMAGGGVLRYSADRPGYATVVHVDADGAMHVLAPRFSNDRSRLSGGPEGGRLPFGVAASGSGYVFVIGSASPFDYRAYAAGRNGWAPGTAAARRGGDPFRAIDLFARAVTRGSPYSVSYVPYAVGGYGRRAGDRGAVRFDDGYSDYGGYGALSGAGYGSQGYGGYGSAGGSWNSLDFRDGYGAYHAFAYHGFGSGNRDLRAHYDRHCADGTLVPYTVPCPGEARFRGDGRDGRGPGSGGSATGAEGNPGNGWHNGAQGFQRPHQQPYQQPPTHSIPPRVPPPTPPRGH